MKIDARSVRLSFDSVSEAVLRWFWLLGLGPPNASFGCAHTPSMIHRPFFASAIVTLMAAI